jgi:hypothetical protein
MKSALSFCPLIRILFIRTEKRAEAKIIGCAEKGLSVLGRLCYNKKRQNVLGGD